jgi:hypothetical protein
MDYETVGLSELGVNGPDADDGDDHPMSPAALAASVVQDTSLNDFSLESNESSRLTPAEVWWRKRYTELSG